jgi:hypothetical protein
VPVGGAAVDINADAYFRASAERMRQARLMYAHQKDGPNYALAMYLSGLAVECMLRAFRWAKEPTFEGRHDLLELFKASGLLQVHEERMVKKGASPEAAAEYALRLRAAMNTTVALWSNTFRFAPDDRVRARLKEMGHYHGVKGDVLKAKAKQLVEAAQFVVDRGVVLWNSKKR